MNEENRDTGITEDGMPENGSNISQKDEESAVPLNFDYYKKKDYSSAKRIAACAAAVICGFCVVGGALKTISKRKQPEMSSEAVPATDYSYPGSPYADDNIVYRKNTTDKGLEYTVYDSHVRITGCSDFIYNGSVTIPFSIEGKPVTEVDYYVFTYLKLKSIAVANPNCIFFVDDTAAPFDPNTVIIAAENSNAKQTADKYGNQFMAK